MGIAALSVLAVLFARDLGWLQAAELRHYDELVSAASEGPLAEPPISLVLIEEADIRRYGHPLPDATLRALVEQILAASPSALAIDLYRDLPVPRAERGQGETPAYRALGELVRGDPRVLMTLKLPDPGGPGTPAPSFLEGDGQLGAADLPEDPGGIIRRGLLYVWDDSRPDRERPYLSIALQLAVRHLGPRGIAPRPDPDDPDHMVLGETAIKPFARDFGPWVGADDAGYQFVLDYRWGDRPMTVIPVVDLLEGRADPALIEGRIVLVGTAAVSVKDSFHTPLSHAAAGDKQLGVAVHAHATHQLLRHASGESAPLRGPGQLVGSLYVVFGAALGAGLGLWNRSLALQGGALLALLLGIRFVSAALFEQGLWLPALPMALGLVTTAAGVGAALSVRERTHRRQLAGLFSRFQTPAVANEIWRRRHEFMREEGRPETRRVVLTALMSDLEGYTSASERMEPAELMSWVNEYMDAMAQLVEDHGGVVDDYAGDGIKANFGFPIPSESEAERDADATAAVRCALAMGARMEALNADWAQRGLPTGRCRVGLFTGPAVVGCIGGDRSLKYTSVGDTVNTAARLEGFGKDDFGAEQGVVFRVLIGEETLRRTRGAFETRDVGAHALKGKDAPVPIYRVIGPAATE
jgi:adenylate cyclase